MKKFTAVLLLILGLLAISTFAAEDCEDKPPCKKAGCYGELCTDTPPILFCPALRPGQTVNQCYAHATCERQKNGECGWVMTKQLKACLKKHPVS